VPTSKATQAIANAPSESKITGEIANAPSDEYVAEFRKLSCEVTGMRCEHAAERILSQGLAMPWAGSEVEDEGRMADLEMLIELRPANAMEAMLTVQMLGTHHAAVKFLLNATAKGQTFEGVDANVLRATRLMRLFIEQQTALAKLRGKTGQQKVRVEHVHVNAGGQAIVGSVTSNKRGRSK